MSRLRAPIVILLTFSIFAISLTYLRLYLSLRELLTHPNHSLIFVLPCNFPDKVRASGVHSLGISDHSLIGMIRKSNWRVIDANNSVTKRQFKNFK